MAEGVLFSCNFDFRDFTAMTARHFAITINLGPDTDMYDELSARIEYEELCSIFSRLVNDDKVARFVCASLEKGETGNWHAQVYVQVNGNSQRATAVKKWFGHYNPHVECCGGTDQDNVDYVKAEGKHADKSGTTLRDTTVSFGVQGKMGKENKGKRNELLVLEAALKENKSERQICDENFPLWARHFKIIDRYNVLHPPERTQAPDVQVHVGAPGTGKTRQVFDEHEPRDIFNVPRAQGTVWFDGYCPLESKICLFDDFYGWAPYDFLLRVTDRYPLNVQVKNGFRPFVCPKIVFTSNREPAEWYKELFASGKADFGAFKRRVTRWCAYRAGEGKIYDGDNYDLFLLALNLGRRERSDSVATEVLE